MKVPELEALSRMPLDVSRSPGMSDAGWVDVMARSVSGAQVTLSWERATAGVAVVWAEGGQDRVVVLRDGVSEVVIADSGHGIDFAVRSRLPAAGLVGELIVHVGERVVFNDRLVLSEQSDQLDDE